MAKIHGGDEGLKFPTREEFVQKVAEQALDEYRYIGRTIREWVALITSTEDEAGENIESALMKLRDERVMCKPCDYWYPDGCESMNPDDCEVRQAAEDVAGLIERLYAVACEKNAEIALLTRERDEWKRRAEAAEHDLSIARHCATCELNGVNWNACAECAINVRKLWKWRGPCVENGGVKEGEENV